MCDCWAGCAHLQARCGSPLPWQVIGIIAAHCAGPSGQASKARAYSGGLIASAAPNLRNVQLLLLGLKEDARRIQAVLDGVDTKVDSIHASMG